MAVEDRKAGFVVELEVVLAIFFEEGGETVLFFFHFHDFFSFSFGELEKGTEGFLSSPLPS